MKLSEDVMVMTMEHIIYGAVNLMRTEVIRELAEHMNDDLYLIPGSIHEIVVIRAGCTQRNDIIKSLRKDSYELAQKDEFLSDSLYFYDRSNGNISIV